MRTVSQLPLDIPLSIIGAAEYWGVSTRTVTRWARAGCPLFSPTKGADWIMERQRGFTDAYFRAEAVKGRFRGNAYWGDFQ